MQPFRLPSSLYKQKAEESEAVVKVAGLTN